MKLLIALFFSGFLHLVWLFIWPLHLNDQDNKNSASIYGKQLELNITHPKSKQVKESVIAAKKNASKKMSNQTKPHLQALAQNLTSQITTSELKNEFNEVYLSTKEVDIQALPMNNIDASMLPAAMRNTQIKLRLFIDEFGKVVRIEPIESQIYQDEMLEAALSERLTDISFIPAKRHGVDVKSYQEVAYDFNISNQLSQANRAP